MQFEVYDDKEFDEYLDSLSSVQASKVVKLIEQIKTVGLTESIKMQWVKKLENNLFEIRCEIDGIFPRTLFFKFKKDVNKDDYYIITNSFLKKTNRIPKKELDKAKKRRALLLNKF